MRTLSRLGRGAAAMATMAALAACAPVLDPQGTQDTVGEFFYAGAADRAMAAITRGDYSSAERHALNALRYNPKDPVALIAAGLAYQASGRYDLARQYYEVVITNRLPGTILAAAENGVVLPRSAMDVARANLAAIDKVTGRTTPRSIQESGRPPVASAVGAPPLPSVEPVAPQGRPLVAAGQLDPIAPPGYAPVGHVSDAEFNAAGRFRILKRLLDEGLVTPDEYNRRRSANIGALLPFTSAPGAVALDRPIPGDEAVVRRLHDLASTLETRAISAAEHVSERTTILDNLLPAQPRKLDNPPLPPKDMIEAGQAVGRVERLRAANLISDAEAKKEKEAIERSLSVQLAAQQVTGTATGLRPGAPGSAGPMAPAGAKATGWAVALTSAKTEEGARKAWDAVKAKFPEQLGHLEPQYKRDAKSGRTKVLAGPVESKDAARKLCKTLKLHRQACDPAAL